MKGFALTCFFLLGVKIGFANKILAQNISKKFTNISLYTNFSNYYLSPSIVKKTFTKTTIDKYVTVKINVPVYILNELFGDLPKAVSLANKYAGQKYQIRKMTNAFNSNYVCYQAFDGYKTHAQIYPLLEITNAHSQISNNSSHFKYFCQGEYKGFLHLKGKFFMELRIMDMGVYSQIDVKAYFQLTTPFLSGIAFLLRQNKSFRNNLNKIINATIQNIVNVGRRTAYKHFAAQKTVISPTKPVNNNVTSTNLSNYLLPLKTRANTNPPSKEFTND